MIFIAMIPTGIQRCLSEAAVKRKSEKYLEGCDDVDTLTEMREEYWLSIKLLYFKEELFSTDGV